MKKLVAAHPYPLQMEWSESVIHSGHPLRHPVVVSVFGLERKLQIGSFDYSSDGIDIAEATIGPQTSQLGAAFPNEPHPYVFALFNPRSSKHRTDNFIIQVRRTQCQLRLFQHYHTEVIGRWLAESHHACAISTQLLAVSFSRA